MDAVQFQKGRGIVGLRQAGVQKSKQKGIRAGEMVQFVECLQA